MKIEDKVSQIVGTTLDKLDRGAPRKSGETAETKTESTSTGSVTLSPMSSQLKSLEARLAGTETFDVEKVNAIKAAISSGQFKVDAEKVADGLISTARDLISANKV